jgi:hypothetical protein
MNAALKINLMVASLLMTSLLLACGGGQSRSSIQGSWTINTASVSGDATLQVTLVSTPCSDTPAFQGLTNCFVATSSGGGGSLSGTGYFFAPPQIVDVGVSSSNELQFILTEEAQDQPAIIFVGTGTVSNGTMSGTFTCDPGTPVCAGVGGTFSGTKD